MIYDFVKFAELKKERMKAQEVRVIDLSRPNAAKALKIKVCEWLNIKFRKQ